MMKFFAFAAAFVAFAPFAYAAMHQAAQMVS